MQNEAYETASRSVRFNIDELKKAAAAAVGAHSCTRIAKSAEGMHSKAFLLRMDDGREVVAKIPHPNAGPPRLTTASEVATMDLMRNHLRTPAPEVYAWCSRAEESAVGAEYIVMEKAAGVPLASVWEELELEDAWRIVEQVIRLQKRWSSATFEGCGSVYYRSDLTDHHHLPLPRYGQGSAVHGQFALGPTTGRTWNDNGRRHVTFDRGPCKPDLSPLLTAQIDKTPREHSREVPESHQPP